MTQFFNDLFNTATNVAVTAHTSDSGHTWALAKGAVTPQVFTVGAVASGGASTLYSIIRPSIASSTADASTTAQFHYDTNNFTGFGLAVRMSADGSSGYAATYSATGKTWSLFRLDPTTANSVLLATSAVVNYVQGSEADLVLSATGTGATVTVKLSAGGVDIVTFADTDAARVTAAGYPGLMFNVNGGAGTGGWFNSMSADTIGAAVADTTVPTMTGTMTSTSVTSSGYTLDWSGTTRSDNVAITGFQHSVDGTTWTDVGNVTSKAFTGKAPSTSYPNYVRAYDAAGNKSTPALQLTVVTPAASGDTTLPTLGGSITVGTVTASSIAFSWPAGADNVAVDHYETSKDGGATWLSVGNVMSSSYTGLAASTSYGLRVVAVDAAGNRSTPALSASATTSAAAAAPVTNSTGLSSVYADRVQDTTSTAGTGTITLAGASLMNRKTFAAAFAVGTKNISYCIADDVNGGWEHVLGTLLTPTTLSRDTVIASSAAGAKVNFAAGTKDVFCTASAQAFSTFAVKDHIDLRDFDVDPTFGNDSQAGIQAAILTAFSKNISRIKCPDGRFKLAGARNVSNAHLYIPNSKSNDPSRTIIFEGAANPNQEMQGLVSMPVTTNGTIFESTVVGNAGSSILRGEAPSASDPSGMNWNYTNVGFRNMGFRTKVDTGANPMTALALDYFAQIVDLDCLRIDVNMPIIACPDPSAVNSTAILMPPVNNHAQFNGGTVLVAGYTNGVVMGEHSVFKSIVSLGNVNAARLTPGFHGSMIGHLLVECTKNSIVYEGNHPLAITAYSTEHNTDGHWFDFVSDINCTASSQPSRKIVIVQSTVVQSHTGVNDANFVTLGFPVHKVIVGAGAN